MFDIGWQELLVLAVLAIIVVGPKDLPRAIKTVTQWIRKARSMARDLQDGLDEVVREAELDDIKKEANKIMNGDGVDPSEGLVDDLDFEKDWKETVQDLKDATDPNAKPKAEPAAKSEPAADFADLDDDPALAPEPAPAPAAAAAAKAADDAASEKAKG